MDDYPDPDEEYEMMHEAELELMKEMEADFDVEAAEAEAALIPPSIKRSLDFASPDTGTPKIPSTTTTVPDVSGDINAESNGVSGVTQLDNGSGTQPVSHKRPAADEFDDDFAEFLDDDFEGNKKKKRKPLIPIVQPPLMNDPTLDLVAHEADLLLIDRIRDIRQKHHVNEFLESAPAAIDEIRAAHVAHVHRRLPDGDFQAVTMESGDRFYLTKVDDDELDRQIASFASTQKTLGLLGVPYSQLKAQAEREQIRQDQRRAKKMQEAEDSGLESGHEEEGDDKKVSLWVERYRPRNYLDLLSDESTNRTVLQWMKLWDKLVFGREKKPRQKEEKKENPFNKFQKKSLPEIITELDEQGRPSQKAILLCGPPGLGKTTLAHIIARHAGYNPVEMNASDDRSVELFRRNLENATTMKAVMGSEKRPNCLIIDEIDGAPAPSINWLVSLLSNKPAPEAALKKKKKKDGLKALHRPVICICNELYTPALRPLRQIALVIQFPPTHSTRLAQRLFEVCRKQRLKADLTVLLALCDKMENDIRGCLSVLQFVRSTKNDLRLGDVDGSAVGQKDYQRSLFTVWHDIFSIPRPKKKRRGNPHELQHNDGVLVPMPDLNSDMEEFSEQTNLASRYKRILRTTESCGEYEKLTQGWFENYPTIKFKHTTMEPVSNGLEWAIFTDVVQKEIMHSQAWLLMAFLPYACVSYHLLFATYQWPKIHFPTQMSELHQKIIRMKTLLTAMVTDMSPRARTFAGNTQIIVDILPFLLHIIQPNLRPVNTQLYSKQEKAELAGLIDTMISYNLTYTQDRSPDGQYSFNLDPNMEELVRFPTSKTDKQLNYATRSLIAREIELEKVRRAELYFAHQKAKEDAKMKAVAKEKKKVAPEASSAVLPNHLQKLQPKPLIDSKSGKGTDGGNVPDVAEAPRDFFGRVIDRPAHKEVKCTTNEIVKSDIWFRFKEGYSNAVRRPIKMKDLL